MATYSIWYSKPDHFADAMFGATPDLSNLNRTHVHLIDTNADSVGGEALERVFMNMQGEVWSPNGEARDLIRSKGLMHTSMSVGDLAIDRDGNVWLVAMSGFGQSRQGGLI